jgi:hypothetical protein
MGHKQDRIERLEKQVRGLQKRELSLRQDKNLAIRERDKVIAATLGFAAAILGKPADRLNVDTMLKAFDELRKAEAEAERKDNPTVEEVAKDLRDVGESLDAAAGVQSTGGTASQAFDIVVAPTQETH